MDTASIEGPELEALVRRELSGAGFTVEPSRTPADGGLSVWHDPARGVVVRWGGQDGPAAREPATRNRGGHDTIRTAVRLALRTILAGAGFRVTDVDGRPELVVTARDGAAAGPRRADGAEPDPTRR